MSDQPPQQECYKLVNDFFKGCKRKTFFWFTTENPLLGNIRPIDLIWTDRSEKLLAFIKNQLDENRE